MQNDWKELAHQFGDLHYELICRNHHSAAHLVFQAWESLKDPLVENPLVEKDSPRGNPTTPHVETQPPRGKGESVANTPHVGTQPPHPLVDKVPGRPLVEKTDPHVGKYASLRELVEDIHARSPVINLSEETKNFLRDLLWDFGNQIRR